MWLAITSGYCYAISGKTSLSNSLMIFFLIFFFFFLILNFFFFFKFLPGFWAFLCLCLVSPVWWWASSSVRGCAVRAHRTLQFPPMNSTGHIAGVRRSICLNRTVGSMKAPSKHGNSFLGVFIYSCFLGDLYMTY